LASKSTSSPDNVFVNCPFDDEYAATFHALLGEQDLLARYRAFRNELPTLAVSLNLDPAHIIYADFDLILEGWLESRPVART
jgi:hypothetical protein